MAAFLLLTNEGKKVDVDLALDECLYRSPVNPPNTGTTFTRGSDLYRHVARSGNVYFFINNWSMWQGESKNQQLIEPDEARMFLLEKAQEDGLAGLDYDEIERAEKIFPGIFDEDA
ncbi:MAG: hypothetical protein KGY74_09435 [Candidatus Cloacimonetes bacterium]|nr:hypothetical protein [Candidatus Cloacimonadota bacterium]